MNTITDQGLLVEEPWLAPLILAYLAWTLVWKGLALYRAGANRSVAWFVVLLLVNTLGIVEILYLFVFSKRTSQSEQRVS
jgi:hypothetical protein